MNMHDDPFLEIVTRMTTSEISPDEGERLAAAPAVVAWLNVELVGLTSTTAFQAALEGQWFAAQLVQRALVVATEQLPDDAGAEAARMRHIAAADWVSIVHLALGRMPSLDGRLLEAARVRGERELERASKAHEQRTVSDMHFRLGVVHLDPYKARASPLVGPLDGQPPWHDALARELGDTVLGVGADHWQMPDPLSAVRDAARHLRAAYSGDVRAPRAAKALASALDTLMTLGELVDQDEVLAACRDALDELDPVSDAATYAEISRIQARWS